MNDLDRYDVGILEALQQEAGLTNTDLAGRIGLSVAPCTRKLRHLLRKGIILKKVAILNKKKLDLNVVVNLYVRLDCLTAERVAGFQAAVSNSPFILECHHMTGLDFDYQLKLVMRDIDHYQSFLAETLGPVLGIKSLRSSFVLRTVVDRTELPLIDVSVRSASDI